MRAFPLLPVLASLNVPHLLFSSLGVRDLPPISNFTLTGPFIAIQIPYPGIWNDGLLQTWKHQPSTTLEVLHL
ncbi:hypothetical protein B0H13DRAFT_2034955, partial [Mycena leptocephala]